MGWQESLAFILFSYLPPHQDKGITMQIDWKWFLIGLVLGLLLGCQPTTEYQNYYIWEQIGG